MGFYNLKFRFWAFYVILLLGASVGQEPAMADDVFASSSEDQLHLSVEIAEAPKLIKITGLEDLTIEKTVGDSPVADLETYACVVMQGGDTYSVQIIADSLTSDGTHYPYQLVVDQNSATRPSITLDVTDSQIDRTLADLQASLEEGCMNRPKLYVRITDVGRDDITSGFSAQATIRLIVQPS